MSPQHLPEMMIPNFSQLVETDLDKIRLDDLTLGFQTAVPASGEIIRGYLQPREQVIEDSSFMHKNRLMNNVTVSLISNDSYIKLCSFRSLSQEAMKLWEKL
jgi:hypothetical protein